MNRLLLIVLVLVLSCSQEADKTFISGTIENPLTESFEIIYPKDFISGEQETHKIKLDENDGFNLDLNITKPILAYLVIENEDLMMIFLEPGSDLQIFAHGYDVKGTISFSGKNADNNTFMLEYFQNLEDKYKQQQVFEKIRKLDPEEFFEFAGNMLNTKLQMFEKHSGGKDLSDKFKNYFKTNIKFDYYDKLVNYPPYHKMLNQLEEEPELPEFYHDYIEDALYLLSDDNMLSANYRMFLSSYVEYYKKQNPEAVSEERSALEQYYYLAEELFEGKTLEYIKAYYIFRKFHFGEFEKAKELYELYLEEKPDGEFTNILVSSYEITKSLLPGNPAPEFDLTDINGNKLSLEDFRGKVVYLDFWATWCGPCMREIPYAKELKKRFKDENDLVFLYISVDHDEEAWREGVAENEIEGIHLNVKGRDHEVVRNYNVWGIPSYFIIDRNGVIFDNNARRPSHEDIDKDLQAALAQEKIS